MSNQQTTSINRSRAFWFGLVLHFALGGALYYYVKERPAVSASHIVVKKAPVSTPVLP
jgi:hypothetical protein